MYYADRQNNAFQIYPRVSVIFLAVHLRLFLSNSPDNISARDYAE